MKNRLTIDKAGRVVLPKPVRDEMRLVAGSELTVEHDGERIILSLIPSTAPLKKEQGIWVYQGERSDDSIPDLLDRAREKRVRERY